MLAVYIAVYFIIFMHQLCYNLLSTCIYVYIVCSWDMARQKYEIGGDNGITNIMLLSYESLKSLSSKQLRHLPETEMVTNGLMIELSKFKDNHGQCTSSMLHSWIKDLFGKNWPQTSPPTTQAIVNSVDRLIAKYRKLQKQHSSIKKEEIISSFFEIISTRCSPGFFHENVGMCVCVKNQACTWFLEIVFMKMLVCVCV